MLTIWGARPRPCSKGLVGIDDRLAYKRIDIGEFAGNDDPLMSKNPTTDPTSRMTTSLLLGIQCNPAVSAPGCRGPAPPADLKTERDSCWIGSWSVGLGAAGVFILLHRAGKLASEAEIRQPEDASAMFGSDAHLATQSVSGGTDSLGCIQSGS